MIKRTVKAIKSNEKYAEHLNAILAENNVESVFDLPAKQRCKEREVVKTKEAYFSDMSKLTDQLIAHLSDLSAKYAHIDDETIDELLNFYIAQIVNYKHKLTRLDTKKRAIELMREVGIPEPEKRFNQYPFEFSGGMRQRIVIAIALSGNPEVLICDEPTTALDVTIQAQILELINRLKEEKNLSIIFITHDLGVVANMADDIAVMYAGKIVEYGSVYDIFYDPRHPYTWALLGSMPDLETKGRLDAIPGTPPNMLLPPRGDAFAARNAYAFSLDFKQEAPFFKISDTHYAKTWLCHDDAPDVEAPRTVVARIYNSLKKNNKNKPTYELKKNSILEYQKGGKK
ncbi:MAG: ABC transporter ATP-binding protein [Bacilli bacterium]|nr:ABC transporter ATP-binding protein [Bacilli bacterium]